jgi:hypothetical protein
LLAPVTTALFDVVIAASPWGRPIDETARRIARAGNSLDLA